MQKFFKANLDPPFSKVNIGDSSLAGEYTCNYCGGACAQRIRFQVWQQQMHATELAGKGCFCLPECSVAFVLHRCPNISPEEKEFMLAVIRERAGRVVIMAAPPPNRLKRFDERNGLTREQWLPMCRRTLESADADVAAKELTVQKTL